MDIASTDKKNKRVFSFSQKLFFSVIMLFGVFVLCLSIYQFQREKEYKISLLDTKLQDYNHQLNETLEEWPNITDSLLANYITLHNLKGLRVTLIRPDGKVFFDNIEPNIENMSSHADRPEIDLAIKQGQGHIIKRYSATTDINYFYSATYFPHNELIIRSALPYDLTLDEQLEADLHYVLIIMCLSLIVALIFYQYTRKLGKSITQLRRFAKKAERNEPFDPEEEAAAFPKGELGEISQHIVRIYQNLKQTQEDKSRLKRQLTQNISHELKTPVSSIQGYLETLINNPDIDADRRNLFLQRCFAQSERLVSLLNDISALNRMDDEIGLQAISQEHVSIQQLLNGIIQEVTLQLEKRHMTMENQLSEDIIVKGDPSLLYSIFRNLTDNAIAYAGEGTTITVRSTKDETFYHFTFADNGVGLATEHLPRIFERFYRIDKGRSRKLGGTGLGLSIVKNAVVLHGGNISATSEKNRGLVFHFTLKR